ncbi:MAG TPA: 50S ribosomal protein L6 [Thermodesulfobacteriota bacterium]|nr:50S ribosomal protein L6 [Thermodesulfobacteriota bacterium]
MSRVGKKPIPVPKLVTVTIEAGEVMVQGPKGTLNRSIPPELEVSIQDDQMTVKTLAESNKIQAQFGLIRSLLANMVKGVSEGFERILDIQGVGYRAELRGEQLVMNLGYSHPVIYSLPEGVSAQVEKQTRIFIRGIDRDLLGLTAAQIRKFRPPEPYKGKGIRYAEETIRRKVGKTGSK